MKNQKTVLEQISIKNAFGIKNTWLDFRIKSLQKDKYEFEDQVLETEDNMVCMVPTFVGKNATGKTSLIKAIVFAMNLINKSSFIKIILHYANFIFYQNNFEIENHKKDYTNIFNVNTFLDKICEQVMFAGAKEMQIKLVFNNSIILVELTSSSFQIKINDQIIDIIALLQKLFINDLSNKTKVEVNNYFQEIIKSRISKFRFLPVVNDSLFRDTYFVTNFNEISLKWNVNKFLIKLVEKFGVSELKYLLKKLDKNITNFEYDLQNKSFSVYMKETDNLPISVNNLSFGTIKTIEILAKSINIFKNGGLLLIDEIENGLHLSLIKLILSFYANKDINSKSCQIILTTHNPLIFKQNIVNIFNAFMFENNNFTNVKKMKAIKRTEDQKGFTEPKNYYNDYYWNLRDADNHTTISDTTISWFINKILKSFKNESKLI